VALAGSWGAGRGADENELAASTTRTSASADTASPDLHRRVLAPSSPHASAITGVNEPGRESPSPASSTITPSSTPGRRSFEASGGADTQAAGGTSLPSPAPGTSSRG